jgi:hypothetical protein
VAICPMEFRFGVPALAHTLGHNVIRRRKMKEKRARGFQSVVLVGDGRVGNLSRIEEVDAANWVYKSEDTKLAAQTLYQQNGFSTTLLQMMESEDDDGLDDTYERFAGPRRR